MSRFTRFFRHGGTLAWGLIGAVFLTFALSTLLLGHTAEARYERDVSRMVFNDNVQLLERVRARVGVSDDTLKQLLSAPPETLGEKPYLVVSIEERKLWYKQGDTTLFETQVATGSGKTLVKEGGGAQWKFETPRGRLVVIS